MSYIPDSFWKYPNPCQFSDNIWYFVIEAAIFLSSSSNSQENHVKMKLILHFNLTVSFKF